MKESVLTVEEALEFEGLVARNKRGLLPPGSGESRRLQVLAAAASGKGRDVLDAVPVRAEMPRAEAMAFYGIKERCWWELVRIGREGNDPVPWTEPEKMLEWFARMRSAGLRKHAPPGEITRRCEEARLAQARGTAGPPPEKPGPEPLAEPLVLGEIATTDEILTRYLRMAAAMGARYEKAAAEGRLDEARTYRAEMDVVTEKIRQWTINAPRIREAEQWVRPDRFAATATAFAKSVWQLLRAELLAALPEEARAAAATVFERLASDLPARVPDEFKNLCAVAA